MQITTPLFNLAPVANVKATSARLSRGDADTPSADTAAPDGSFARLLHGRQKASAPSTTPTSGSAGSGPVYPDPRVQDATKPRTGLMQGTGPVKDPATLPVTDESAADLAAAAEKAKALAAARTDRASPPAVPADTAPGTVDPLTGTGIGNPPKSAPIDEPDDEPLPDQPIKVPPGIDGLGAPLPPAATDRSLPTTEPVGTDPAADTTPTVIARTERLPTANPSIPLATTNTVATASLPVPPVLPGEGRGPVQSAAGGSDPISLTPDTGEGAPLLASNALGEPKKRLPAFDATSDTSARLAGAGAPSAAAAQGARNERADDTRRSAQIDLAARSAATPIAVAEDAARAESKGSTHAAEGRSFADTLSALGAPVADAAPRLADPALTPVRASIDTPATSPEFREALGVQVSLLVADGVQTAELHLNPADMGPISVQIVTDGTQAKVDFGADSAVTRQIIESGLPELASALRDAGITLTGGGVSSGSSNGQADDGSATRARGVTRRITLDGGDLAATPAIRSPNPGPRGEIDLYA